MEAEEDLFVVIVGDSSVSQIPLNNIKLEPAKDQQLSNKFVEYILKQASQFGTFLNNDDFKIHLKHEHFVEEEYLDQDWKDSSKHAEKEDISGQVGEELTHYTVEEFIDHNEQESSGTHENIEVFNESQIVREETIINESPKKSKSRNLGRSVVAELRDTYPELQQEEFLVDTVKELMKTNKAPPLPIHYCKHVINNKFQCTICDVISVTLIAAGRHYEENHGPRYLTCYACGASFRRKENLYKHEQICSSPDARIVLKARDIHLGWYATDRKIVKMCRKKILQSDLSCPVCYAQFPDIETTRMHTKTVHVDLVLPYKCTECKGAFKRPSILRTHVKNCHSGQTYICDICSHAFKIKTNLIAHLETHLCLRNHVCDQCPKRYTTKSSLIKHINKVHKNLPPTIVCHICHKRVYLMWELKLHMKKEHSSTLMSETAFIKKLPSLGEPTLKNTKLITKQDLERLNNETMQQYYEEKEKKELELKNKKRFYCTQCDKSYVLKVDLKIHIDAMHSGQHRPVRCQVCHRVFSRMDLLKRHMKRQHRMTLMSPENFQRALPNLTKAQIEEAQIVLKPPTLNMGDTS